MTRWLGISLGDVTGVGPEVALKAIIAEAGLDDFRYLLIGDQKVVHKLNTSLALDLPLTPFSDYSAGGKFFLVDPLNGTLPAENATGSAAVARASVAWLREGAERCLRGELDGLVTAPVNKESIIRAGQQHFVGQTEFLSQLAGTDHTAMMLLGTDDKNRWLRVALATVHIAIKAVPEKLTRAKIMLAIELAAQSCRELGLPRARIAVAGLNPHAGEGGEFGDEEITTIAPAV